MTKSVRTTWDLPTKRESGRDLDPATLAGVDVGFSADDGANFVSLAPVAPADIQESFIPDLVDGDYIIRLEVRDLEGAVGVAVDTGFFIDTSAPGVVQNVVVVLE